jgi:hypothetical protein
MYYKNAHDDWNKARETEEGRIEAKVRNPCFTENLNSSVI